MAQLHSRRQKDANFINGTAISATSANSASFDLGQLQGGTLEEVQLEVSIPAVAGITDAKVLTFTLQDSADNVNFTAVDPAVSTTVTGVSGQGTPAKVVEMRLPVATRRYVRIAQVASATPGTVSGSWGTALLF